MLRFFILVVILASGGCSLVVHPNESQLSVSDGGMFIPSDGSLADRGIPEDGGGIVGDAGACPLAPSTCIGGTYSYCEGYVRRVRTCEFGCATSATRCAQMVPSNLPISSFRGDITENIDVTADTHINTTSCYVSAVPRDVVVQPNGAPEICVLPFTKLHVLPGVRITVSGSRPLALIATSDIIIDGTIDASAVNHLEGPGAYTGGRFSNRQGNGWTSTGGQGGNESSSDDGGGGGGGLCGAGGGGGRGAAANGGNGGGLLDTWDLSPLFGGSGGGFGTDDNSIETGSGRGGGGGGALQLSSRSRIIINGRILAGGGAGSGGGPGGAGGGGGSGGAILLEAPVVTFGNEAVLNAAGGGGGGSGSDPIMMGDASVATSGLAGANGSSTLTRASGGFGVAVGGDGGGTNHLNGDNGESLNRSKGTNGGGGGGGAGCILVRTSDGQLPAFPGSAAVTPFVGPGIRALQILRD